MGSLNVSSSSVYLASRIRSYMYWTRQMSKYELIAIAYIVLVLNFYIAHAYTDIFKRN